MPQSEMTPTPGKLKRLIAMSPREVAYRVRQRGSSQIERFGWSANPKAPEGISFKSYLAGAPANRFYRGHQEPLRTFVRTHFPEWITRAVQEAEALCHHEVELLNLGPIELGREINWHRDPVTGQIWERLFWTEYRPENDPSGRDPKIIFELNRHQHLARLAKAYRLTGNERYAAEVVEQLLSWIQQNPPGVGINWQSSLELGIRSLSWLWTLFLILPSNSLNESAAQCIGDSLFAQLEHVHRHLSLYSSPNTHLIGEAAALFIAGIVFRDRKPCDQWMETGAALLAAEAEKQILSDGVYGELSSYYHCYALDFYLQATILAKQNRFEFPAAIREKIAAMLYFLMHITRPDGTIPLLGDDDGGRAFALDRRDYRSFNDGFCLGAVLFLRQDFKYQSGIFAEQALWLLGEEAWDLYRLLESKAPTESKLFCPSAGYFVQRSGWGPSDSHVVFDFGGLGMLTGGHSHADALSVTLFSGNREILIDPGTFVYNCAPEWRGYFRSTRAHNTVTVDGRDQAELGEAFRWNTKISSWGTEVQGLPVQYVEGEHDGYASAPGGVIHRRRLVCIANEYWILVDDFRGSGQHTFDFNFHFGSEVDVSAFDHRGSGLTAWAEDAGFHLAMFASGPMSADLVRGETTPIRGWLSHGYGEKKPTQSLRTRLAASAPASAMTFLAVGPNEPVVRRLNVEAGDAIACAYQYAGFRDIVVYSSGADDVTVAEVRMRGQFVWLRMKGSVIRQAAAIRTSSLYVDGRNLLEDPLCAQFAA
jgi:hypothetical protein